MGDRETARDQAEKDESDHGPFERCGLGNAQNLLPELQSQEGEDREAGAPGQEIDEKKPPQRVIERADGGNDGSKRERRRSETGDSNGDAGTTADPLFQLLVARIPGDPANSLFTQFVGYQGEQTGTHRGTAGRRENKPGDALVMASYASYDEEIVSERKNQEGRIENSHYERPEVAQGKQEMEKWSENFHYKV